MYCIYLLKKRASSTHLPVYLDSPMATDATRHVPRQSRRAPALAPSNARRMCHAATIVNKVDDSRALSAGRGPMVIISASGMATGGRVVHHLKAFAPDRRNTILFAGYQAGGTRGAAILQGASTVRIHGEDVPIGMPRWRRSTACPPTPMPARSSRGCAASTQTPRRTFVTHGEPEAADAMRARIDHELGWSVAVPDYLQTVDLV
jgi:metallo-beta-lactamase family protein